MKQIVTLVWLLIVSVAHAQENRSHHWSIAYEGGFGTHPGFSLGYQQAYNINERWGVRPGLKVGLYHHKRYQTAIFILPEVLLLNENQKGRLIGPSLQVGFQKHYIPNTFSEQPDGSFQRNRDASTNHLIIAPGLMIGRKIKSWTKRNAEWYLNPQFQFRHLSGNSSEFRFENYLLIGLGARI